MKKSITLLTLLATAALLTGCNNSSQQNSSNAGSDVTDTGSSDSDPIPAFVGVKTLNESGEEVVLEPVDGAYNITNTVDDQEYHVYGEISEAIVFTAESSLSAKLMLHNATLINESVSPIQWLASSKKIKVNAAEGVSSIVCRAEGVAAISSENNCDLQGEGGLSISSNGTCVSATSVAVEGSGTFALVSDAKNGISCKELTLGEASGATAEAIAENTFHLSVTAAKTGIKAELNSKSKKGTIDGNFAGEVTLSYCGVMGISSEGAATLNKGTIRFVNNADNYSFASESIAEEFILIAE